MQLGNATSADLFTNAGRVLSQYRYTVEHTETTPQLVLMQSAWLTREPHVDEMPLGVTDAQNRITLNGRWRLETQQGPLYAVDVVLESRVIVRDMEGWREAPDTRSWREYSAGVIRDLRQALDIGTRRF
jgi:hypothetical protein